MSATVILGTSHKMYFGWRQTLDWCRQVAACLPPASAADSRALQLFTFPASPTLLPALQAFAGTGMGVGAQNMCAAPPGAWTGETSAAMLQEMGCRYIELGHAERRRHFGETTEMIIQKLKLALTHRLTPVICIGEAQRVSVPLATQIAIRQARELLDALDCAIDAPIIFAWEPQWAIGAPAPAGDDYIRNLCRGLRRELRHRYGPQLRVIYGGSAGAGLLTRLWPDVDGLFLGRFAHQPASWAAILQEARRIIAA